MLIAYTITIFLSAALLFLVQPMIAKMVLPMLGGSPSVWITAMLFFQALLLAGYAYAHALCRLMGFRRAAIVHAVVVLVPLAMFPVALPQHWAPPIGSTQAVWLLGVLLWAVGAPFFVLSATGPILQRWFSHTDHPRAHDPYFLYAASNAGSLIALLAYPLILEPTVRLGGQASAWAVAYAVFAACMLVCAAMLMRRGAAGSAVRPAPAPPRPILARDRLFWVLLAFVPSSLMLGVTNYMTTDIAAVPLLWVVPLSLYLLTFVLAFARRGCIPLESSSRLLPIIATALVVAFLVHARTPAAPILGLHLTFFFFAALICHTRLARARPAPERLTEFFLFVSIGGVLGGVFNALVAPALFNTVVEYPLLVALACLLRPAANGRLFSPTRRGRTLDVGLPISLLAAMIAIEVVLRLGSPAGSQSDSETRNNLVLAVAVGLPALAVFLLSPRPIRFAGAVAVCLVVAHGTAQWSGDRLFSQRTFFGVYHVERTTLPPGSPMGDSLTTFSHGTTLHGQQADGIRAVALGYYHPDGPIGHAFNALADDPRLDNVAIIGLGVGALATYAQPGQRFTFYEIDEAVLGIALNTRWFTYLADCKGELTYHIGDGRIKIAQAQDGAFGLIVLDAFSSDAIPVHLLTREAFEVYLGRLRSDGVLAVHITNRHLDLAPVVAAAARDLGLAAIDWFDIPPDPERVLTETGRAISHWVLLARSSEALMDIFNDGQWQPLTVPPDARAWTDDYSNILGVFRWD